MRNFSSGFGTIILALFLAFSNAYPQLDESSASDLRTKRQLNQVFNPGSSAVNININGGSSAGLSPFALMGCHEPNVNSRLWGHYSQARVNSLHECALDCSGDSMCHAVTWDPYFRAGNTNYNCWKFQQNYQAITQERGFTSLFCSMHKA